MPEFILPAEVDHCPHCGAVLRDPPNCCPAMIEEHAECFRRARSLGILPTHDDPYQDLMPGEPFYPNEFDGDSD